LKPKGVVQARLVRKLAIIYMSYETCIYTNNFNEKRHVYITEVGQISI